MHVRMGQVGGGGKDFFEKTKRFHWDSTPLSIFFEDSSFPSPPLLTVSSTLTSVDLKRLWLIVYSTTVMGPLSRKNIPERYQVFYALLLS